MKESLSTRIKTINDWAAIKLAVIYGAAITIWVFAAYSLCGALVTPATQASMLYWSNAAQLVFCPLMVYVGNSLKKKHDDLKANNDALHDKVDKIHEHLGIK